MLRVETAGGWRSGLSGPFMERAMRWGEGNNSHLNRVWRVPGIYVWASQAPSEIQPVSLALYVGKLRLGNYITCLKPHNSEVASPALSV